MKKKSSKFNKKRNRMILVIIAILIVIIIILSCITVSKNKLTKDERYFKIEYEKFNGEKDSDNDEYIKVNIKDKNGVEYLDGKEAVKFMKNGTGIIYFGFPQCFWCRSAAEVLLEAKDDMGLDKLYYYNAYKDRDEKYLDSEGNILTLHKGSDEYYEILNLLGDRADKYDGLNDDSIKRLYFPTVLFIKKGNIVDMHVSTVDSNKSKKEKLTDKEYKKLKKIYIAGIKKIK